MAVSPSQENGKKKNYCETDDLLLQCFLTTQMHAGLHVRGLPSKVGLSLFKGEANLLCCLTGRKLKVNQYEKKKLASHVINTDCACFFPTGGALCARSQRSSVTVYIKHLSLSPIMHLWGTGQALLEIGLPNMESTAARAPMESSLTDTCTH